MKKAIIIGHTGQDGSYLWDLLVKKKYALVGISRSRTDSLKGPEISEKISVESFNNISVLIQNWRPDSIYYLAAMHQSSSDKAIADGELFKRSMQVNVLGLSNCLEAVRLFSPATKIFYAASSHVFGNPSSGPQNEKTPYAPECIYGISKVSGINVCRFYRKEHGTFASVGIFYNHESPRRESKYVSKKIVETAVAISKNRKDNLEIGSLEAPIDWGYAPDYVWAAYKILQLKTADDFIVSSGKKHIVKDFVKIAFEYLNLDWKKFVRVNQSLINKNPKPNLLGNNNKLKKSTGWKPSVSFKKMVELMVEAELKKG